MADKHFDIVLPEEVMAGFGWTEGEVTTWQVMGPMNEID